MKKISNYFKSINESKSYTKKVIIIKIAKFELRGIYYFR